MGNNQNNPNHDLFNSFNEIKKIQQGIVLQHKDTKICYLLK